MDNISQALKAGLIGAGIQASLTPAMHIQEGAAQGLRYDYELIDLNQLHLTPSNLPALLDDAEARGFCGLNITHPCKQVIIPFLHELSDEARALGAVNTVVLKDGRRFGHNTDWWGFAESFRRGLPDAELNDVVQLGAGGAGAATAFAILTLGAKSLTIFDQEQNRAETLAASMQRHFPQSRVLAGTNLDAAMAAATGLIHATPMGMAKYPGVPLPSELLRPDLWVAEIVYFPLETELLKEAARRGCRVLNGGGMAVFQAVGAFRLFTGREPDIARMTRHFETMTA
ncbi:shikimate dehydrogenase [Neorhizobium sp. DT-125]|uniref:shikimate dehydrogenase n=1 Tax=Neorhizobium sp. DT-125 TaxID=3396163 RepID=UPI003F1B434F